MPGSSLTGLDGTSCQRTAPSLTLYPTQNVRLRPPVFLTRAEEVAAWPPKTMPCAGSKDTMRAEGVPAPAGAPPPASSEASKTPSPKRARGKTRPPDVMAATRWLEHLNVLGVSRFAAVLNRIQHNVKTNTNTARLKLNAAGPLVPVEIPQYEVFNDSFGLGVGPQEIARSPATDYVEGLWAFVRREIGLDR